MTPQKPLLLNVPFVPDKEYARFLLSHQDSIHSLHFAVFPEKNLYNARINLNFWTEQQLVDHLPPFKHVKKYALLNTRFVPINSYFDRSISQLSSSLEYLINHSCIDGIVFTDFYLLEALSKYSKKLVSSLEAVPSINCMLDSFDKIKVHLETIERLGFRFPKKITVDRSLNRKLTDLKQLSEEIHRHYPDIKVETLVNEGCLYQCPYKLSHDSHISLSNINGGVNLTQKLNTELGCISILGKTPSLLFKSPFIRPEDISNYSDMVDIFKICGRTLSPVFLQKTVSAYLAQQYHGNLLELMDTMEWLAHNISVNNHDLPIDFFRQLTSCDKNCRDCSYCQKVFTSATQKKPLYLKDLRH